MRGNSADRFGPRVIPPLRSSRVPVTHCDLVARDNHQRDILRPADPRDRLR